MAARPLDWSTFSGSAPGTTVNSFKEALQTTPCHRVHGSRSSSPKAVDVDTWGVAALGADRVDRWFGFGAAYRMWKGLRSWGRLWKQLHAVGRGLLGLDGNGQDAVGHYRQGVLSAEWTAGAITMVRNMIEHYHTTPEESVNPCRRPTIRAGASGR